MGKRKVRRRVAKALKKYVRGNPGARYSVKYSWHEPYGDFSTRRAATAEAKRLRDANRQAGLKGSVKIVKSSGNPPRVKGRKTKGGRAVTLRNFTGTVVKKSDGTVQIVGRGRRK